MGESGYITKADLIRSVAPIVQIVSYGNGCYETKRKLIKPLQGQLPKRGIIVKMTKRSLVRLMFVMQCTRIKLTSMLTLTYPGYYPQDGSIVKNDLAALIQKVRRQGFSYVWFLEFQKRGAPHIHLLLNNDDISPRLRIDYGLYWTMRIVLRDWFVAVCPVAKYETEVQKIVKFNCHPSTWQMIRNDDGARNYVTKYASKERQKKVPPEYMGVGRFWGASRDVMPDGVFLDVDEKELSDWLERNGHPAHRYDLIPRYLWGIKNQKNTTTK